MKRKEVPQECIETLRLSRPEIAITVSRIIDEYFRWDGEGPDPVKRGYYPYDVDVKATCIINGTVFEGSASLGGSYFKENEPINEIHGYLPQMVEEAIEQMDAEAKIA